MRHHSQKSPLALSLSSPFALSLSKGRWHATKASTSSARTVFVCLVTCLMASTALAQDRANIDRTQIIGNRELPKVLYIVPWKKPVPSELSGRPVASVLDEALAPIDRDVFRRQVQYDTQLVAAKAAADTLQPAPTAPVISK